MVKVIARQRGFFGGEIREPGTAFEVPDELWDDDKRRPRWAAPAAFGGKGDHDGDGKVGGSKPAEPGDEGEDADKPKGKGRPGRKPKAETVQAPTAAPFADAPEPIRATNEIAEATGSIQPDWVAPQPVAE